ncbi:MAG: ATP-binding cassette domain-containing protein [Aphanizomenon sp.]
MLRLESVNFYGQLQHQHQYPILQDISLRVSPGDRLSIVGVSGAGKTSLLRLINRLSEPTSGKIYFKNQEYSQIPVIQLRQQVILVQQESKLLGMTVGEALAYPLILRGLPKQKIQEKVSYWQEQLQIPEQWLGRTEVQLAAGQRQLIAITRALVTEPQILLLDEPTSALDTPTSTHLMSVLTHLNQPHSSAILMVNRQIDLVQEFCTHLLHLQKGQLVANRPAAEIDWDQLATSLTQAETQALAEWI